MWATRKLGRGGRWLVGAALVAGSVVAASPRAASQAARPLPDRATFLDEAKERLRLDADLLAGYTYSERETRIDYDGDGTVAKRVERLFEVFPSVAGSPSDRRLVWADGVAVSKAAIDAAERKYRQDMALWAHERARESAGDRARREARIRADQRDTRRLIDDGFRILDVQIAGRETIHGRPTIVVTFTPRPGAQATVGGAEMMTRLAGRAWMDEEDRQMVRLEARAIDTLSYGLGILVRVAPGSTAVFERQKVNGTWLPARCVIRATGRFLLLKRLDLEWRTDYSNYRPFSPEGLSRSAEPRAPR